MRMRLRRPRSTQVSIFFCLFIWLSSFLHNGRFLFFTEIIEATKKGRFTNLLYMCKAGWFLCSYMCQGLVWVLSPKWTSLYIFWLKICFWACKPVDSWKRQVQGSWSTVNIHTGSWSTENQCAQLAHWYKIIILCFLWSKPKVICSWKLACTHYFSLLTHIILFPLSWDYWTRSHIGTRFEVLIL